MPMFDGNGLTVKPHVKNSRNNDISDDCLQASVFYRNNQEDDIDALSDLSVNFDDLILPETKAFSPLKTDDKNHWIKTQKLQQSDGININEKDVYDSEENEENQEIV